MSASLRCSRVALLALWHCREGLVARCAGGSSNGYLSAECGVMGPRRRAEHADWARSRLAAARMVAGDARAIPDVREANRLPTTPLMASSER